MIIFVNCIIPKILYFTFPEVVYIAFSALTLLVGGRKGIQPVKKYGVMRCWCGYLSGARCKWFAYGSADATATLSSLASAKSRMVCPSGAGLPRLSWKNRPLNGCMCVCVHYKVKQLLNSLSGVTNNVNTMTFLPSTLCWLKTSSAFTTDLPVPKVITALNCQSLLVTPCNFFSSGSK